MEKQIDNIEIYLDKLFGLPVSLAWSGYGSAIFLELGKLFPIGKTRKYHQSGEACIDISWDWRCEKGNKVLFGSSNNHPEIDNGIKKLKNKIIKSINLVGKVKELEIIFEIGRAHV